jgi:protein subunit release factor A
MGLFMGESVRRGERAEERKMSEIKKRELSLSFKNGDFEMETFRAGGKGGQNQNKRDTGVRFRHKASGAAGESREERSQLQNKKTAFKRLCDSPKFRAWLVRETHIAMGLTKTREQIEKEVDETIERDLREGRILIEEF